MTEPPADGVRRKRDWECSPADCTPDCDCVPDCSPFVLFLGALAITVPGRAPRSRPSMPARAGMLAIRGYQRWVSARLGTRCRHVPSCSNYGLAALARYGLGAGSRLTLGRIRRCAAPVPHGTADPVP